LTLSSLRILLLSSSLHGDPRYPPSFPTRRSSDLVTRSLGRPGRLAAHDAGQVDRLSGPALRLGGDEPRHFYVVRDEDGRSRLVQDRKSTRLNSSHGSISYAVFCLKKKKTTKTLTT